MRLSRALLLLSMATGLIAQTPTWDTSGNGMLIAAPLSTPPPGTATFKGSYSLAYMDLSTGNPSNTIGAIVSMNPDGAGNLGTVGVAGYVGQRGSSKIVQSLSNVKYIFSN